jgi:hypothetical protein
LGVPRNFDVFHQSLADLRYDGKASFKGHQPSWKLTVTPYLNKVTH